MKKHGLYYLAAIMFVMLISCVGFTAVAEGEDATVYSTVVEHEYKRLTSEERKVLNRKNYGAAYSGKYGNQLSGLDREIYDSMVKKYVTEGKSGTYTHTFKTSISFKASVIGGYIMPNEGYINAEKKIDRAMQLGMDALLSDYPELFWLFTFSSRYSITAKGNSSGTYTAYISSVEIVPYEAFPGASSKISQFKASVNSHISVLKKSFTDINDRYEVLKTVHDYICNNAYYNMYGTENYVFCPAAFFIGDGGYVCEGYAETFKIFCDKLGIPCVLVIGDAGGPHMWNYVQMEDEKWYLVDATWDDQDDRIYYDYFLANYYSWGFDEQICYERTPDGDFNSSGYMTFSYPQLSTTAFTRHYHQWESEYRIDSKPTCVKTGIKSIHCKTCKAVKDKKSIAKTGHSYTYSVKQATVSADGKRNGTCKVCGNKASATIYKPVTFALSASSYGYSGKAVTPSVTVKDSKGNTLKNKTDYTVSYSSGRIMPGRYAVKINFKGNYSGSKVLYFTITPGVTSKVTAKQNTSAIQLNWNKVTGATGYRIYRYDDKNKKYVSVGFIPEKTSFTVKNLTAGTKYKFSVRAYVNTSAGAVWGKYSKVLLTSTSPAATKNLRATQSATSVKLTWNKVSCATGYRIYKLNTASDKFESVGYIPGKTEFTVKKLTAGTKYKFRVRAYINTDLGAVWGGYSNELLTATKPAKPTGIRAQSIGNEIKLNWNKVPGATGYRIYKLNPSNGKYESVGYVPGKESFTVKKLAPTTVYYFKVRTYINTDLGAVWSDYSDSYSVYSAPAAPRVTVSKLSAGRVRLNWNSVYGATGYEVYYSAKSNSGYKKLQTVNYNQTSTTLSNLSVGRTYYFRVRAISRAAAQTMYGSYVTVSVTA